MSEHDVIPIIERDFDRIAHELTYREQKVLGWLYGFRGEKQHTLKEAGQRFGITQARIKEMQAKAIELIRDNPPKVC